MFRKNRRHTISSYSRQRNRRAQVPRANMAFTAFLAALVFIALALLAFIAMGIKGQYVGAFFTLTAIAFLVWVATQAYGNYRATAKGNSS